MGFPKISCLKNNQRDGGSREKVDCKTMSARRAEIKKSEMKIYLSWKDTYIKIYPLWKDSYPIQTKIISLDSGVTYHPKKNSCPNCMHCVLCANCPEIQLSLHYREWFVLFRETIENVLVHIVQMITVVW